METTELEAVYEEISESHGREGQEESRWSEFSNFSVRVTDPINYYINEYKNTAWVVYENCMESEGYTDPVCKGKTCRQEQTTGKEQAKEKVQILTKDVDGHEDEYEIPEKQDEVLKFDILPMTYIETILFVH